jgi:hypothetical protein
VGTVGTEALFKDLATYAVALSPQDAVQSPRILHVTILIIGIMHLETPLLWFRPLAGFGRLQIDVSWNTVN